MKKKIYANRNNVRGDRRASTARTADPGPDRLHFMVCRTIGGNKTRNNDAAAATLTLP